MVSLAQYNMNRQSYYKIRPIRLIRRVSGSDVLNTVKFFSPM